MSLRPLAVAFLAVTACGAPQRNEGPQGAVVELVPVDAGGAPATVDISERGSGLAIAVTQGDLGQDPLQMRIADDCPAPGSRPSAEPTDATGGEDAGSTQAGTKGERAASTPATADETGQAADRMRPTSATPKERTVQLRPTRQGFEAPRLTVDQILGRALIVEGPSGRVCGEAHPPVPAA